MLITLGDCKRRTNGPPPGPGDAIVGGPGPPFHASRYHRQDANRARGSALGLPCRGGLRPHRMTAAPRRGDDDGSAEDAPDGDEPRSRAEARPRRMGPPAPGAGVGGPARGGRLPRARRGPAPGPPRGVVRHPDLVYRTVDGRRARLDVYVPEGAAPPGGARPSWRSTAAAGAAGARGTTGRRRPVWRNTATWWSPSITSCRGPGRRAGPGPSRTSARRSAGPAATPRGTGSTRAGSPRWARRPVATSRPCSGPSPTPPRRPGGLGEGPGRHRLLRADRPARPLDRGDPGGPAGRPPDRRAPRRSRGPIRGRLAGPPRRPG